jgi:tRNA-Thr(GGU) m(6)t(6)A37 methyltransferase TsaA
MPPRQYAVTPVGTISSALKHPAHAPLQGDEGAPDAYVVIDRAMMAAMSGLAAGDRIVVLTWLHAAQRDVLVVHPRGDVNRPAAGVFSTRSPHRPNPIGLHTVTVLGIAENRIHVSGIEAIDGTPVIDIKPVLGAADSR